MGGEYSLTGARIGMYPNDGWVLVSNFDSLFNKPTISPVPPLLEILAIVDPLTRAVYLLVMFIWTIRYHKTRLQHRQLFFRFLFLGDSNWNPFISVLSRFEPDGYIYCFSGSHRLHSTERF